jgi:hypothetical protein
LLPAVICPVKVWDLKTQKGVSDFGCLKDKWARFECKSRSNFLVLCQTQGVQIIEEASQWGVRWQRRYRATHYEGPVVEWERRILCTVECLHSAEISEKMQSARESVITEFRWFAGQRPVAWIT